MNCYHHPNRAATTGCRSCEKPLCAECAQKQADGSHLCSLCAAALALDDFQEEAQGRQTAQDAREAGQARRKKIRKWVGAMVILVCLAGSAYQIPRMMQASRSEQPVRIGSYATDKATDRCIANLWLISRDLQSKRTPDESLRCPATGQAYRKIVKGSDVFYECPNPEAHHLTGIFVGNRQPIPKAQ